MRPILDKHPMFSNKQHDYSRFENTLVSAFHTDCQLLNLFKWFYPLPTNTTVVKDFGSILPNKEISKLVLRFPSDLTNPMHPDHCVFSSVATVQFILDLSSTESFDGWHIGRRTRACRQVPGRRCP